MGAAAREREHGLSVAQRVCKIEPAAVQGQKNTVASVSAAVTWRPSGCLPLARASRCWQWGRVNPPLEEDVASYGVGAARVQRVLLFTNLPPPTPLFLSPCEPKPKPPGLSSIPLGPRDVKSVNGPHPPSHYCLLSRACRRAERTASLYTPSLDTPHICAGNRAKSRRPERGSIFSRRRDIFCLFVSARGVRGVSPKRPLPLLACSPFRWPSPLILGRRAPLREQTS